MTKEEIKKARENAGYSRKEICQALGLAYSTVQYWELGRNHPPKYIAELYCYWLKNNPKQNKDINS